MSRPIDEFAIGSDIMQHSRQTVALMIACIAVCSAAAALASDVSERTRPERDASADDFPPPESKGGWRTPDEPDDIRRIGGMDPAKLSDLMHWLLKSDNRNFAAVVIRNGHIVLEVERGNSAKTD